MLSILRALQSSAVVSLSRTLATSTTLVLTAVSLSRGFAYAQNAAPGPNSDPTYQALRNITLSGEAVSVSNFELKRDAGTFHLRSGTICFVLR